MAYELLQTMHTYQVLFHYTHSMRLSSRFSTLATTGLSLILGSASIHADTFSWNNITYAPTPTAAQQTTILGAGGGGNSLSIQFALNNGATFLPTATVQSPAVSNYNVNNTYYTSGGATNQAENFLQIGSDLVNSTNGIGSITVNLFFAKPVTNLSFSFFDVDINAAAQNTTAAYADQINNIYGTTASGAKVYLGTNGLTPGTANGVIGTAGTATYGVLASANNVNNLAGGNATATFASVTPVTELSYTYGDGYTGTGTHGAAQITGLSDLTFNTVPEPGSVAMMVLGGVGAGFVAFRRRRA